MLSSFEEEWMICCNFVLANHAINGFEGIYHDYLSLLGKLHQLLCFLVCSCWMDDMPKRRFDILFLATDQFWLCAMCKSAQSNCCFRCFMRWRCLTPIMGNGYQCLLCPSVVLAAQLLSWMMGGWWLLAGDPADGSSRSVEFPSKF